jgi:hypothetical protein
MLSVGLGVGRCVVGVEWVETNPTINARGLALILGTRVGRDVARPMIVSFVLVVVVGLAVWGSPPLRRVWMWHRLKQPKR